MNLLGFLKVQTVGNGRLYFVSVLRRAENIDSIIGGHTQRYVSFHIKVVLRSYFKFSLHDLRRILPRFCKKERPPTYMEKNVGYIITLETFAK